MTPHKLTFAISIGLALVCCSTVLLYQLVNPPVDPVFLVLLLLLMVVCSYVAVRVLIERFIYRRIKPIYKVIQRAGTDEKYKLSGKEFNSDIISSLDDEVSAWTTSTRKEIESLKSLEQYRKDYVGNVSHELKTPIFAIQGYIHTLLEMIDESQKLERKFLNRTVANADRLALIVSDLELISRIESDANILEIENLNIRKLVNDVFVDLEVLAAERQVNLRFKSKENTALEQVSGDKTQLRTVFVNLLENSIKYGKEGGTTSVGFYDMDERILVEVSDDGMGIDEKHHLHLFDRFYRVEKSRNRDIAGSGLGLAIVKHILEAHGQEISVRSVEGDGTAFSFTLPKSTKQ